MYRYACRNYVYSVHKYRIRSSKCPWVLAIDGAKTEVGAYLDKPFVCIMHNIIYMIHRSSKRGVGAYTEMGAYSREYGSNNILDPPDWSQVQHLIVTFCG